MVYYGALSKGCQRCRQRKIKCDQRRPGCLRCQKAAKECPGYRDLGEVLFRDESQRIIRRSRQLEQPEPQGAPESPRAQLQLRPQLRDAFVAWPSAPESPTIPGQLAQPIHHLGASFFFAKYTLNEPPFTREYHEWLAQSYLNDGPNHALRTAIEAVGMAGISNLSLAPDVATKSGRQYGAALASMKRLLDDPAEAVADTTLMAVILLGMFEAVVVEARDWYQRWESHVQGAAALLELRGPQQFDRQRGGLLYVQIRSQILTACMQQHIAVPPALVQTASSFQASGIREDWHKRQVATSGSISQLSLRLVDLRAAFKSGSVADPAAIRAAALAIEDGLEAWIASLWPSWAYRVVDNNAAAAGGTGEAAAGGGRGCFGAIRHEYPNLWTAAVWNNWRTMRIVANQIILQNELRCAAPDHALAARALSLIRDFSAELCASAASFDDSPRILTLIRPLYVVALEELNARDVRGFAVAQLRRVDATMGVRQAGLMADMVARSLGGAAGNEVAVLDKRLCPAITWFP